MVLGKLPVPGRPTILIAIRQGPAALAVGAGEVVCTFYSRPFFLSSFSLSLGDGWLVGCFGFNGPLRQYCSLYQAVCKCK